MFAKHCSYYSFASVREGTHILLREFNFVKATPHNRASFVHLFWRCFANIARKTGVLDSRYFKIIFEQSLFCSFELDWRYTIRLFLLSRLVFVYFNQISHFNFTLVQAGQVIGETID